LERRGAVLFDAAGTLIELREPVGETYAHVARKHGVTISPKQLEVAFRGAFRAAPAMAFPGASIEDVSQLEKAWWRRVVSNTFRAADRDAKFPDFDEFFEDLFDVMGRPQTWREVPGTRGLLMRLRSLRWAIAIVSNFDRRLPNILQGLGLAELFDTVVLCSDVGAAKPEAAIFHCALERLQVPASQAVVVGDDEELDIAGARAAGLRAIDVKSLAKLDELVAGESSGFACGVARPRWAALLDQLAALPDHPGERRGGSNHGE
jgi:putative hydrolase of the HAD superfamily